METKTMRITLVFLPGPEQSTSVFFSQWLTETSSFSSDNKVAEKPKELVQSVSTAIE